MEESFAAGMASSALILAPPPDSPNIVTLPGRREARYVVAQPFERRN